MVADWSLTIADYSELVADQSQAECSAAGRLLIGDHTRSGKLVAMVYHVEVAKTSRREVAPWSQALWDRGLTQ